MQRNLLVNSFNRHNQTIIKDLKSCEISNNSLYLMFLTTRQASRYLIPYSAHSNQSDSNTGPVGSCLCSLQTSVITFHLAQPSSRCPHSGLLSCTQSFSPFPHFLLLSLGAQGPPDVLPTCQSHSAFGGFQWLSFCLGTLTPRNLHGSSPHFFIPKSTPQEHLPCLL